MARLRGLLFLLLGQHLGATAAVVQALRLLEASGAASGDSLTVGRFCSSSADNDIIAGSGAAVAGGRRLLLVANASSGSAAILAGPAPYRVGGLPAETLAPSSTLPHSHHHQTLLVVTLPPPPSVSLQPTTTAELDRLLAVAWGRSSGGSVYLQLRKLRISPDCTGAELEASGVLAGGDQPVALLPAPPGTTTGIAVLVTTGGTLLVQMDGQNLTAVATVMPVSLHGLVCGVARRRSRART